MGTGCFVSTVGAEADVHDEIERYRRAGDTTPCAGAISKTDFDATLRAAIGA